MFTKVLPQTTFYRRVALLTIACIVVCGFITVNLLLHGPRIRKVEYDPVKVTRETNQTIIFRSNQPLKQVAKTKVKIEPAVDFQVTTSGEAIIMQLKQRLNYDTNYTVQLQNIESQRDKTSQYSTSIHTAINSYYYLKRNVAFSGDTQLQNKDPDQIFKASLNNTKSTEVFSAYKIVDYALAGNSLIVNSLNEDDTSRLTIFNLATKQSTDIKLPEGDGEISKLRTSSNKNLFGFLLTSNEKRKERIYENTLFIYDSTAKLLVPMEGVDGKSVSAAEWKFMPDGTSIIAQTYNSGITLIDSAVQHKPIPLGNYSNIGNFSPDGSKVLLNDNKGPLLFSILDKSKTTISDKPLNGITPLPDGLTLTSNSDNLLRRIQIRKENSDIYDSALAFDTVDSYNIIYRVNAQSTMIDDFATSPNDQYVTIEQYDLKGNLSYDDYPENAKPASTKSLIVDSKTGKAIKDFDGFKIIWE